jgi:mono/diheme cytochrome c family protein
VIAAWVSPAEARRLASALLAVLAGIGLLALFGFLVVPGLRYQADPDRAGGGWLDPGWCDPTDCPPTKKQVIPPLDPATVMTATPALLARGRELYDRECATCHGPDGKGDGPGGRALNPRPRDFSSGQGWDNGPTLPGIYRTLEVGVPGSGMGSFSYLARRDRMALAHLVQSLGSFDHGADPAAEAALARRFAASGETIPNRIPVQLAVDLLCREYAAAHPQGGPP